MASGMPAPAPEEGPVVVAEFCPAPGLETLERAGCRVIYDPGVQRDRARLLRLLHNATGLVVRNQVRVDTTLLDAAPRLRVVGRLGAGLDNINGEEAVRRGVTVVYAPGGNARAVAEFVLAQMLALARRLPAATAMGTSGVWVRQGLLGEELAGTRVGILGLGRIGRALVPLLRPLVDAIATYHPRHGPEDPRWRQLGIHWLTLEELLAWSDYLVVLLPLRPATRGLLDRTLLTALKPGARIVVTGRGGVVDENALADLLRSGHLAGAALDVRALEPPGPCDPLRELPNVVLTPHIAGLTVQAQERIARSVAEDLLRVLRGLPPLHPAFVPAARDPLRPGPLQG